MKDKIRNEQISKNHGIQVVLEYIEQRQLSWWGYFQRNGRGQASEKNMGSKDTS